MGRSQRKSTEVISQRQLRKMTMIIADRWSDTYEIVSNRHLDKEGFTQRLDFWLKQISF
ncbi:MAG: hypothetical protein AAFR62_03885 [Cyanobacteria bacterium J06629_2]